MAPGKPLYDLQCTAGPAYDLATHGIVPVNAQEAYRIESDLATIDLYVRIQEYTGIPKGSPSTHSYFEHPDHVDDRYSIAIEFTPKKSVSGNDLVFGNDFDRPIRDRMPPGSNYALKIVKWWIDPGLEGDAYADQPYLYGPALSSWNHIKICGLRGEKKEEERDEKKVDGPSCFDSEATCEQFGGTNAKKKGTTDEVAEKEAVSDESEPTTQTVQCEVIEEGAEGSGIEQRECLGIPATPDQRRKFFLNEANREAFTFEAGRIYKADFGNSYISFSVVAWTNVLVDFSLRLPGFKVIVTDYIDEKHHELRYVLKNKKTGELYFSLRFNLLYQGKEGEVNDGEEETTTTPDEKTPTTESMTLDTDDKAETDEID
ncbi:hypothetical protein KEM54_002093 [Ascosphaera aggregata]|nr:hypothetical protein KEM54_002093 [Ascosphaera aggregata]